MGVIKRAIEGNFSLLLLIGFILGFFVPSVGGAADEVVIIFTACLVFFSCASIKTPDLLKVDVFQVAMFTLVRFAVLPLVLFYAANQFFPEYSVGVLLLALMPAGVAVSALCSMSGANVALGLSLTVISSLLAPAFVPGVFSFLGQVVNVDISGLFITLSLVVFLPIVLYFGVAARIKPVEGLVKKYNKSSSIVILALVLIIVVAAQKEEMLSSLDTVYVALAIMTGLFAIFYAFGALYSLLVPKGQRIPYIYSSGAMNNSLAVGLAFLYFSPQITLFIVLSEIVWSFYVALAQWLFPKFK